MLKSAIVRFVGNQDNCKLDRSEKYRFINGHLYNAYFLEYWQGERTSLHVKGEDGEVSDFNPFDDFEVIEDCDNVLNDHEAIVRCVTHDYDEKLFDLTYGHKYKAIGFDINGMFLVMDDSYDCYFYPCNKFEIVKDPYGVLDSSISLPVYDWENTHKDSYI